MTIQRTSRLRENPDENDSGIGISTWFVSDSPGHASFFPQIGGSSGTTDAEAIYWRCILCFSPAAWR
jgi:hypothetical protein